MSDAREEFCESQRTVQMGRLAAVDLTCTLMRWQHIEAVHFSTREFGDVFMTARWPGEFESGSG